MKKAIIIGASSGIGKALAIELSQKGIEVGLMARREELLTKLQNELSVKSYIKKIDVTDPENAIKTLKELISEMNQVDLIIMNAGIGRFNERLDFQDEKDTIITNVLGFTAIADCSVQYFLEKKQGHFVGISSIAALRGSPKAPAYSASKAYVSNYLEGLYMIVKSQTRRIDITDIRPGYVDTEMIKKSKNTFWVASSEKAAKQIVEAIEKKKRIAYITKRWNLIAFLAKIIPISFLFKYRTRSTTPRG